MAVVFHEASEEPSTEVTLYRRTGFLLKSRRARRRESAELIAFLSIYHPEWPKEDIRELATTPATGRV